MRRVSDAAGDVTVLLQRVRAGEPGAADALFGRLYGELKRIAGSLFRSQRSEHTLQPTALVHEAYVKMLGATAEPKWNDRAHFLSVAARAMRQVLVNHARDKGAQKRGGGRARERLTFVDPQAPGRDVGVLDLHDALEALEALDERQARIAELRLFGGLATKETAAVVGIAPRTVELDWKMAKEFLADRLAEEHPDEAAPES